MPPRPSQRKQPQKKDFSCLVQKLSSYSENEEGPSSEATQRERLLSCLDVLTASTYPLHTVSDADVLDFLMLGCRSCPVTDDELCLRYCTAIAKACGKRQLNFVGKLATLESVFTYLFSALERPDTDERYILCVLRALAAVGFENGVQCHKMNPGILPFLVNVSMISNGSVEVRRMAIHCMGNLCVRCSTRISDQYPAVVRTLLSNLCDAVSGMTESCPFIEDCGKRKLVCSALRSLMYVVAEDRRVLNEVIGQTVDVLRKCCFYGITRQSVLSELTARHLHMRDSSTGSSYKGETDEMRISKQETEKWIPPTFHTRARNVTNNSRTRYPYKGTTSDSEQSDSEQLNGTARRSDNFRIQHNALLCLQVITKASPKLLHPYWASFLPEASPESNIPSLMFHVMTLDPSPKLRIAACHALTGLFDGSKQYLLAADDRETKTSFTPLSQKLGAIIREAHKGLLTALTRENDPTVIVSIFKCCEVLVSNCTFSRLSHGHPTRLFHAAMQFTSHEESSVRISAFAFLATLTRVSDTAEEISALLSHPGPESVVTDRTMSALDVALERFLDAENKYSVAERIGACNLVCSAARAHFVVLRNIWYRVENALSLGSKVQDETLKTASIKILEEYARSSSENDQHQSAEWWLKIIDEHIRPACGDEAPTVRAIACECASYLSKDVFDQLPDDRRIFCVTLFLGLLSDENPLVKASACRALGVFVQFTSLREDQFFLVDMASALLLELTAHEPSSHSNLNVKMKAGWALANLCDSLVALREQNRGVLPECCTDSFLGDIIKACIATAKENEKLRSNAVRALGSVLKIAPVSTLSQDRGSILRGGISTLIANIEVGPLKGRWNACHACGNMLQNENLPIGQAEWTEPLFKALTRAISDCKNFKVRINAAQALVSLKSRPRYGEPKLFSRILESVIEALENIDNMGEAGFAEFKYMEQLKEQLGCTLGHVYTLVMDADRAWTDKLSARAESLLSSKRADTS